MELIYYTHVAFLGGERFFDVAAFAVHCVPSLPVTIPEAALKVWVLRSDGTVGRLFSYSYKQIK